MGVNPVRISQVISAPIRRKHIMLCLIINTEFRTGLSNGVNPQIWTHGYVPWNSSMRWDREGTDPDSVLYPIGYDHGISLKAVLFPF